MILINKNKGRPWVWERSVSPRVGFVGAGGVAGRIFLSLADSVGESTYGAVFGYESVEKMATESIDIAFYTPLNCPQYVRC